MTTGGSPLASDQPRNRAERRAAARRRGRKAIAAVTGVSMAATGMGVLFASPAGANTFTVTSGADSGGGSLRQAVDDANNNPGPDTITFSGVTTVTISGGSIPVTGPLVIDGSGAPGLVITTNSGTHNGGQPMLTSTATSLTIEHLTASGGRGVLQAGVLVATDSAVTMVDVIVSGNDGIGAEGGAVHANGGSLTVQDSTFSQNRALYAGYPLYSQGHGGAIWTRGTALSLTDTDFDHNSTQYTNGGAVYIAPNWDGTTPSTTTISGGSFTDNQADSTGGAVFGNFIASSELNISGTTFSGNHANGNFGGAVSGAFADTSELNITGATFNTNTAGGRGGAISAEFTGSSALNVTGATFSTNHAGGDGGAIRAQFEGSSTLNVATTTFDGNDANSGGAVYARLLGTSSSTISGATFTDNEAQNRGGGALLYAYGGSHQITLHDTTFGQVGHPNAAGAGGGFRLYNGNGAVTDLDVTGSTSFVANTATYDGGGASIGNGGTLDASFAGTTVAGNESPQGGGIRLRSSSNSVDTNFVVTDSRIVDNVASGDNRATGGGIWANSPNPMHVGVVGSTISGNSAASGGGVYVVGEMTDTTIAGSTVSGNHATATDALYDAGGGGLQAGFDGDDVASVTVSSSTFSGNTSTQAGGAIHVGGDLSLDRTTVTANQSDVAGGGIATLRAHSTTFTDSIVGGNTSAGGADLAHTGAAGTMSSTYALVTDVGTSGISAAGGNVVGHAPLLGALANNGGTTQTHLPLSGSPAIDAGDPAVTTGTDQRGLARVSRSRVDIGSVEVQQAALPPAPSSTTPTTQPPSTPTTPGPNGSTTANVGTSAGPVTLDIAPPSGGGAPTAAKVTVVAGGTLPAGGLKVLGTAFEITVQGGTVGTAKVCFPYSQTELAASGLDEAALQLFHFLADGSREVITSTLDTVNNRICGDTNSFSPFAIGVLGTKRVAGIDAPSTAATLSAGTFSSGVPVVYLTTAGGFADALGAGPAAGAAGGPTLLVRKGEVPAATQAELARLKPAKIVLVGGTAVISEAVQVAVSSLAPKVERVAGADRAETAAMLSAATFKPGVPVVYVVNGSSFADGLVAGAAAAANSGPVLLTGRDSIPAATQAELARLNPAKVVVVGGTAAVSDAVLASLKATRLAGLDRYATAAAVAETFAAGSAVLAATGEAPADALAAVAAAAKTKSAVVLVRPTGVPARLMAALGVLKPKSITVVGGTAAVDLDTEANLAKGLGS